MHELQDAGLTNYFENKRAYSFSCSSCLEYYFAYIWNVKKENFFNNIISCAPLCRERWENKDSRARNYEQLSFSMAYRIFNFLYQHLFNENYLLGNVKRLHCVLFWTKDPHCTLHLMVSTYFGSFVSWIVLIWINDNINTADELYSLV